MKLSVKAGFCPSHRNFKQSASLVGTDRFKLSGIKAATRLLILKAAEILDVLRFVLSKMVHKPADCKIKTFFKCMCLTYQKEEIMPP